MICDPEPDLSMLEGNMTQAIRIETSTFLHTYSTERAHTYTQEYTETQFSLQASQSASQLTLCLNSAEETPSMVAATFTFLLTFSLTSCHWTYDSDGWIDQPQENSRTCEVKIQEAENSME